MTALKELVVQQTVYRKFNPSRRNANELAPRVHGGIGWVDSGGGSRTMVIFHKDCDGFVPAIIFETYEREKRVQNCKMYGRPREGGTWRLLRTAKRSFVSPGSACVGMPVVVGSQG